MKTYNFADAFYKMLHEQKFGVRTRNGDPEIYCIASYNIDHPVNDSGIDLMEYCFEDNDWDRRFMISAISDNWLLFDTLSKALEYAWKLNPGDTNE